MALWGGGGNSSKLGAASFVDLACASRSSFSQLLVIDGSHVQLRRRAVMVPAAVPPWVDGCGSGEGSSTASCPADGSRFVDRQRRRPAATTSSGPRWARSSSSDTAVSSAAGGGGRCTAWSGPELAGVAPMAVVAGACGG
mgnify:CR=1 FL=1